MNGRLYWYFSRLWSSYSIFHFAFTNFIKLNIKTEEVDRLYKEYWKLRGLHKLNEIYAELPQRVIPMRYELPNTVIIDDSNEFVQYLYNNCKNLRTRHEQQHQTRDRGFFAGEI